MSPSKWIRTTGRSQAAIAKALGCSSRTLRRRLAGKLEWSLSEALRFEKLSEGAVSVRDIAARRRDTLRLRDDVRGSAANVNASK
jgi:hypothetical protein